MKVRIKERTKEGWNDSKKEGIEEERKKRRK
jgi:hypothetical protein